MTGHSLHITLAQINPIVGDIDYNLRKVRKVRDEAPKNTDLIIFPEMTLSGYPPEDLVLNRAFIQKASEAIDELCRESANHHALLFVGAPLLEGDKIYNAAHVIGGRKIIATIKKHHLPNYGVFDDKRVFEAGPLPEPIAIKDHKIGFMICEDMWFTDVAARLKEKGAQILIAANASPYETGKHERRLLAAAARMSETGLPLLYLNQVGGQDDLVFDGASFALSEQGRPVLQANSFAEDIHHMLWENSGTGHWLCAADNITPVPTGPEAIYRAAMTGLRDYVTKSGFPGVILGLSGGIDSALAAAIAVDALGADAVQGVLMPSPFTSQDSIEDAQELAHNLGIHTDTIPIESAVQAFENLMQPHFNAKTPGTVQENIQPRCRGIILMALSNANGRMVLSTGNKSEIAVGYATLYGDMCGGYNPLKDIYKTQIYELARWRNAHKPSHSFGPQGPVIPERCLTKAPTAELKPNQTDQDSLPPYDLLDTILEQLIEQDKGTDAIASAGFDRAIVEKIATMVRASEYKRRQAAPGPKISARAFYRERRYPLVNGDKG